jgi:hypothetical protein
VVNYAHGSGSTAEVEESEETDLLEEMSEKCRVREPRKKRRIHAGDWEHFFQSDLLRRILAIVTRTLG